MRNIKLKININLKFYTIKFKKKIFFLYVKYIMIHEIIEYLKENTISLLSQIVMLLVGDCVSNNDSCTTYHIPKNIPYTVCNILILLFVTILKFVLSYFNKMYNKLPAKLV